ncbi:conserved hypothetical protein [Heliomicrobium modesticaldum Ice1]|uniref:Transcobalamin-like C-terminal domain-containing protein n=1 Tax=Heliobacterium modesticaldum (strain ATCC 51547 / Ice1) TaxID=498761 RepID=B0TF98_HELMI|nr:DUF4430 domain-containing protein [Heliomicrobium modesticaldum]ABZ84415.1 conserved hypothetical protein [Heliomicrobium modesticaldum Ice1]
MGKKIGWHWGFLLVLLALLFGAVSLSGNSGTSENIQTALSTAADRDAYEKAQGAVAKEPPVLQNTSTQPSEEGTQKGVPSSPASKELTKGVEKAPSGMSKSAEIPAVTGGKEAKGETEASVDKEIPKGLSVSIAVVGQKGELLFGPESVLIKDDNRWGKTPLGALEATGLRYGMGAGFGSFVTSINGQVNQGMRGWMYKVNDETPMVAANQKAVQRDDRIIWWYSNEMDAPSPDWEALLQQKR